MFTKGPSVFFVAILSLSISGCWDHNKDDSQAKQRSSSSPSVVSSRANTPPVASFTASSRNMRIDEGGDLVVTVSATDDGLIEHVRLYLNNQLVSEDTAAPYTWPGSSAPGNNILRELAAGSYTLRAEVVDDEGLVTRISTMATVVAIPIPVGSQSQVNDHAYPKTDGPFKNPLKGWNSGWWNDSPESSVGFQYISWKEFEPVNGQFNYDAIEDRIARPGSQNRHLILRLHCDWWGEDYESECPSWIYSERGVARIQGDNGRYITDYNNPAYIEEAIQAIRALAERYDDDPRIYAFQMGMLGYWGEWHTFGSDFGGNEFEIAAATQQAILAAYDEAFSNKQIMGRYPWRDPMASAATIGFHNDYFVPNNGHSDGFDESVASGRKWLQGPIGGEVPPRDGNVSEENEALFNSPKGTSMIATGHYSTMKPGAYQIEQGQNHYEDYMRLHKLMGYNYQIDLAKFADTVDRQDAMAVEIIGTNIGVAPMYYDWQVQVALLDSANQLIRRVVLPDQLSSILETNMFNFSANIPLDSLGAGNYKLAVRIIQPGADVSKGQSWQLDARNVYILFANDMPVVDGYWNNQNALVGGWSILGNVALN